MADNEKFEQVAYIKYTIVRKVNLNVKLNSNNRIVVKFRIIHLCTIDVSGFFFALQFVQRQWEIYPIIDFDASVSLAVIES